MAAKQVILITGANTGLGYEAVKALCQASTAYDIIVGSRSEQKGEEAINSVKKEVPQTSSSLSTMQVDISSDDSIEKAVSSVASKHGHLDVLVNNAGASFDGQMRDGKLSIREGFNKSWDTNVAGTEVLTTQAMPLLLKSSNPRLIFITSGTSSLIESTKFDAQHLARINASPEKGWPKGAGLNPITSYRSTKTGLNMLMREWTRILKNDGVKVWAISPGFLATGLGGVGPEMLKKMGALDPSEGGIFIREVIEGQRDHDVGKVIRRNMDQPW